MALLKCFLLIAIIFLSVVDSAADVISDEMTENNNVLQNDDMGKMLEIMKSQGELVSRLEAKIENHADILIGQEETINKLKSIIEVQSKKISELLTDVKSGKIKTKNLETEMKRLRKKCAYQSIFHSVVAKNRPEKTDHEPIDMNKGQLHDESSNDPSIQRIRRDVQHISFSVYLSQYTTNLGQGQTIKFDQVLTNDGNAYNSNTGVFTVPVTGTYVFIFYVSSSDAEVTFLLKANGYIKASGTARPNDFTQGKDVQGGGTVILRLSQGVSVWIENWLNGGKVYSTSVHRWVTFSGFLLY